MSKLSGNDRIDELAYRMMRGQLDNGKSRYDKTYKAGYTESERAAAQSIVNQKDWEGLKERHDARVANKDTHYSTAAETEVVKTDYTPNKDIAQSRSADIVSPASQSTGGQSAADAAAKARLAAEQRNKSQDVAVNRKPVEQKQEAQPKQETTKVAHPEPQKSEEKKQPKQETTKVAHPEPQKSEEKKQPKQEATQVAKASPKISEEKLEKAGISKANKNERKYQGLTSTQWGEIAARKDLQDGLRKDGKGANYDILYANGDIDKTKFDSGYKSYMEKNKKPT